MWTTPKKVQQLVKKRLGLDISTGKAEGLIQRAELFVLRACEDRPGKPPYTLGPQSSQIASKDKRSWLTTPGTFWDGPGAGDVNYVMWDVAEEWVGMKIHQDEPHNSYLFFHKKMCLLRQVGKGSEELCGVFERAHKLKPDTIYPDPKKALNVVSRYVRNNDKRITIPRVEAIREDVPFIPLDDADVHSIATREANGMKLFFHPQNSEDLHLSFEEDLWVLSTRWTKWVCVF